MYVLAKKFKEAAMAVMPIVFVVVVLHFTLIPLGTMEFLRFLVGAAFIIAGLGIFLLGVDLAIVPIGQMTGSALVKSNKILILIVSGLAFGFMISAAEPDLHIQAGAVERVTAAAVTQWQIVLVVSAGIAFVFTAGLLRIVRSFSLKKTFLILYSIIFILGILSPEEFLAIAFDASGATTGALSTPFILAVAFGTSQLKRDSGASEEDSFGLVGIVSSGAIIGVLTMSILAQTGKLVGDLPVNGDLTGSLLQPFIQEIPRVSYNILLSLLPILVVFLLFQKALLAGQTEQRRRVLAGMLYSFVGLVFLLSGAHAGFMEVGTLVGYRAATMENKGYLLAIGFVLGFFVVIAEPAVHALTHQIQVVTSGSVRRRTVLGALSLGIGIAIDLSMLRIMVPGLALWHFLLPGYLLSLSLMSVAPALFVGIAFDSGGVASGPMTATFILAFAQGAAQAMQGADVLLDGFGVIAMVAMTPLITLQLLGLVYKIKSKKGGVQDAEYDG